MFYEEENAFIGQLGGSVRLPPTIYDMYVRVNTPAAGPRCWQKNWTRSPGGGVALQLLTAPHVGV